MRVYAVIPPFCTALIRILFEELRQNTLRDSKIDKAANMHDIIAANVFTRTPGIVKLVSNLFYEKKLRACFLSTPPPCFLRYLYFSGFALGIIY